MSSHIEYTRFRRGDACTEDGCTAKKFYIENGKKYCQRGHEQYGFTQTQVDEDDWNAQGKKSRKKREEKEKIITVLSGSEAREFYLQCYQLILWKQCHWLVTIKGFPPELETVVRDLWDLRTRSVRMTEDRMSGLSSTGGSQIDSQSESEAQSTEGTDDSVKTDLSSSRKHDITKSRLPTLAETLGLCYLGILLLRLPTSLGELYKWATRDELIYTRAIKEVPKDMRVKLPPHFHSALELSTPLKHSSLQRTIQELIKFYYVQFEMIFPPLNTSLLLVKHVRDLGLPIETIPATQRLASLLKKDIKSLSYPSTPSKTFNLTTCPEVLLISLLVIAVKLSQPFDSIKCFPSSDSDPTTVKIDWKKWMSIMADPPAPGLKRGEELGVKDDDVWKMDGKTMDDYMDWYQRTWIDDRNPKMPVQILDLFPLAPIDPAAPIPDPTSTSIERLKAVHESLIVQAPLDDEEVSSKIRRPGQLYKRYRKLEELPETAKAFYTLAASNAGLSTKSLVKTVFTLEVQLDKWVVKERKREILEQREAMEEREAIEPREATPANEQEYLERRVRELGQL